MVVKTFNPRTQGAEVGRSLTSRQPDLQSKFLGSQGVYVETCLEKQTNKRVSEPAVMDSESEESQTKETIWLFYIFKVCWKFYTT